MKNIFTLLFSIFFYNLSFAQCPELKLAMVNSCGLDEGNNEFIMFYTNESSIVGNYNLNYGTTINPFVVIKNLSGLDATTRTGVGTISTGTSCPIAEITNPNDSIPAFSRVIFIPANFDQNYDLSGTCNGTDSLYVVYIDITSPTSNSTWSAGGNFGNSGPDSRYLQLYYSGNAICRDNLAEFSSYVPDGNWANTSGPLADGNVVSWNDTNRIYSNNGCSAILVPLKFIGIHASNIQNTNIINWETSQEISISKFNVEKSYNGKDFSVITSLNPLNNNTTSKRYQYTDKNIEYTSTYYRIKAIDQNGRYDYSKIVVVTPTKSNININALYPIPAKDNLVIEWNCAKFGTTYFTINDYLGKTIQKETIANNAGFNQHSINVSRLPHGKYIITIATDEDIVTKTFTK